jgi:hypothetical protein
MIRHHLYQQLDLPRTYPEFLRIKEVDRLNDLGIKRKFNFIAYSTILLVLLTLITMIKV